MGPDHGEQHGPEGGGGAGNGGEENRRAGKPPWFGTPLGGSGAGGGHVTKASPESAGDLTGKSSGPNGNTKNGFSAFKKFLGGGCCGNIFGIGGHGDFLFHLPTR